MNECVIQLGRWGDILNILPFVESLKDPALVVAKEFASIHDAINYAWVIPFDGECHEYERAVRFAETLPFSKIHLPQVYEHTPCDTQYSSFMEQAYANVGCVEGFRAHRFDHISIPLRYPKAEKELRDALFEGSAAPVLVCFTGLSSPFLYGATVLEALTEKFPQETFVDLGKIHVKRFTDLLGLMDRSKLLITVDSGPLHLAGAHGCIPYIAYLNDDHEGWLRGYCRGNCIDKIDYSTSPDLPRLFERMSYYL